MIDSLSLSLSLSGSPSPSSALPLWHRLPNIIDTIGLHCCRDPSSVLLIISILLSKVRSSVLIISTDPAHNLSDAFQQRFTKAPTLVNGFTNLYAMEIDPTVESDDTLNSNGMDGLVSELANAIPGIDEAMSFVQQIELQNTISSSFVCCC